MSPFSNSEMSPFFEVQSRTRSPRFDIAPRTGDWTRDGSHWVDRPGRAAQIYVFAWHGESRAELCDQSNAEQWLFYVVREECLPVGQKSIALGTAAGGRAYSGKRRSSPTRMSGRTRPTSISATRLPSWWPACSRVTAIASHQLDGTLPWRRALPRRVLPRRVLPRGAPEHVVWTEAQ